MLRYMYGHLQQSIFFSCDQIKEVEMNGACGTYEGEEKCMVFCDGGNLKGRDHSEDIKAD